MSIMEKILYCNLPVQYENKCENGALMLGLDNTILVRTILSGDEVPTTLGLSALKTFIDDIFLISTMNR